MAALEEFKNLLQKFVEVAKENEKIQGLIKDWVSTYTGKVMAYKVDGEQFYLVVMDDGNARLENGEYPSPDLYLYGDAKTIFDVVMGRQRGSRLAREGKIGVWGNWHESRRLQDILLEVKKIVSEKRT